MPLPISSIAGGLSRAFGSATVGSLLPSVATAVGGPVAGLATMMLGHAGGFNSISNSLGRYSGSSGSSGTLGSNIITPRNMQDPKDEKTAIVNMTNIVSEAITRGSGSIVQQLRNNTKHYIEQSSITNRLLSDISQKLGSLGSMGGSGFGLPGMSKSKGGLSKLLETLLGFGLDFALPIAAELKQPGLGQSLFVRNQIRKGGLFESPKDVSKSSTPEFERNTNLPKSPEIKLPWDHPKLSTDNIPKDQYGNEITAAS